MMRPDQQDPELILWERGEWEHLPYLILEAYVDESLDDIDREIVEGHFATCNHCVAEARVLRAERAALATETQVVKPSVKKPRWWLPILTGFAGAGVATGVLWLAVMKPLDQERQNDRQALVTAQAQASKDKAALLKWVTELEAGRQNTAALTAKQSVELAALRQKVALLVKEKAKALVPPALPMTAPTPIPLQRTVQVAQREELELPDLSELRSEVDFRGPGKASASRFALLAPIATRVRSAQPTLTWQTVPRATRYEVLVADTQDRVLAQGSVGAAQTRWKVEKTLPRGTVLVWEVHAYDAENKELASALNGHFSILTKAQEDALSRRLGQVSSLRERGRILAEYGLLDEAIATLRILNGDARAAAWLKELQKRQVEP
ncbi:hypothetical protein [Armatimonas sp.]|uniref:hypothetical protein n=1 Tax=Armatimonas sp. TaxID=1872638 RepID=UPI00374DDF52